MNGSTTMGEAYPQSLDSVDLERALLGAVFQDNRAIDKARQLRPDDFSMPLHGEIWRHVLEMRQRGKDANPVTLKPKIQGDDGYLVGLLGEVITVLNAGSYANQIRDHANRRRLIALAENAISSATNLERPCDELIAGFVGEAQKIAADGARQGIGKRDVVRQIYKGLSIDLPCYSTGLPCLDEVMGGGLFAGRLYGIAARKKVGKSLLLGTISHNLNMAGTVHQFAALEMSPQEIEQRNIARVHGFNSIEFLKRQSPSLEGWVQQYGETVPDNTIYEPMNIRPALLSMICGQW